MAVKEKAKKKNNSEKYNLKKILKGLFLQKGSGLRGGGESSNLSFV